MRKQTCVSSNIAAIGFNDTRLYIKFNNGRVYVYFDVPEGVYDQMTKAESVGKFFHSDVRNAYPNQSEVSVDVAQSLGFGELVA